MSSSSQEPTGTSSGTASAISSALSSAASTAISSVLSSGSASGSGSGTGTASSSSSSTVRSTTVRTSATPTATNIFDTGAGTAQSSQGMSLEKFVNALAVSAIVFGAQLLVFVLLRKKLQRIYEPRTYLVPEKRRTPSPAAGLLNWFKPIFQTATSDFIAKSGLDAYFFLRYLWMLLKLFLGYAIVILPILLPINYRNGKGSPEVRGLDQLAWGNIQTKYVDRYWAHLWLACGVILYFAYTVFTELRKYIRMRQMYLTSPQHRLRASATTVLVSNIPKNWLTVQKLVELYDVFPGGIRNIWLNRDMDDLQEKVDERDRLALALEGAETEIIKLCKKKNMKMLKKEAKKNPASVQPAKEVAEHSDEIAMGPGLSSGNPHQIPKNIRDASAHGHKKRDSAGRNASRFVKAINPINVAGQVGQGIGLLGRGVGRGVMGGVNAVTGGARRLKSEVDDYTTETHGFERAEDDEEEDQHHTTRGSTLIADNGRPLVHERTESHGHSNSPHRPRDSTASGLDGALSPLPDETAETQKRPFWKRKTSDKFKKGDEDEAPLSIDEEPVSPRSVTSTEKPREKKEYELAYDPRYEGENWGEPVWKKYIKESDRPTMRLPLAKWMPSIPLIGRNVDTITYCRKEIARLNLEIERDQETPDNYPLMNSAFIQFNQQVAAHMACQCLSHHIPQFMTPRTVEISPNDVVWGNMKMQWWERYLRYAGIMAATGGLIIGWAIPTAFVGTISQIENLQTISWLKWLDRLPDKALSFIGGVMPPVFIGILMALLPIILRTFARIQGCHTGMDIEKSVQGKYFSFLFIQVFLVVSISSGITAVFKELSDNPLQAPQILADNLPAASNFFFSYLLLQAFSVSGAALVQIVSLLINYLVAPIVDTTARQKFTRSTSLQEVKWGTFFPIYTNLACIGIVYSVISPIILIFNCMTFSLFWLVYRYNLLFVNNIRIDTGGLLFPRAINQLFTGIYVMEVCIVGLFFLVRDAQGDVACFPQAVIMIIFTVFTVLYQFGLNGAFGPLLTYLPITLEDDAAERDVQFAKEQEEARKHLIVPEERPGDDLNEVLEKREQADLEGIELSDLDRGRSHTSQPSQPSNSEKPLPHPTSEKHPRAADALHDVSDIESGAIAGNPKPSRPSERPEIALFDDIADEIEDLTPEERDVLVARAFQHPALRAKRPVCWIPRDELGVSDDEVRRTMKFSGKVWVSNEYAGLDKKGRVVFKRSPPDFDMRDLVEL